MTEPVSGYLLFSTMDILFVEQFGQYLFQLASTSTRVQALIRYMHETVTSIEAEFKTMNDLAQKYVRIIDEDAESVGSDVGLELFEFLVTGGPSPTLKEWLVDTLTERVRAVNVVTKLLAADLESRAKSDGKRAPQLVTKLYAG